MKYLAINKNREIIQLQIPSRLNETETPREEQARINKATFGEPVILIPNVDYNINSNGQIINPNRRFRVSKKQRIKARKLAKKNVLHSNV